MLCAPHTIASWLKLQSRTRASISPQNGHFLAWIRTGLGLMGVGFAVARFGLFLRQMRSTEARAPLHGTGLSVWSGIAIVSLGVVVLASSIGQHLTLVRELSTGTWRPGRMSRSAVTLASLLAVAGVGMAVYLLILR